MSEWQSGKEEGGELEGCILMWGGAHRNAESEVGSINWTEAWWVPIFAACPLPSSS